LLASHFGKQLNRRKTMRTFQDALPADATRRIHNLNRRLRYRQSLDRPKCFAGQALPVADFRPNAQARGRAMLQILKDPPSTATYVSAWCWLNHLLEA
jgi:hypothetical protein